MNNKTNINLENIFGCNAFGKKTLEKYSNKKVYQEFLNALSDQTKEIVDIELANKIADAMKKWAIERGATHFTHWFQPMNGFSVEKHESFLSPQNDGTAIAKFSGKELVKGEADGSSFPTGGLRSTFEARGYTAWDASGYAFVKNNTLYIPTSFFSYAGHVLDKRTPLHRSSTALKQQIKKLLSLFKINAQKIKVTVGIEQEYFLIPKELYEKRLDLKITGRTLFGARSPKTQELEDHYYGSIKQKVMDFMIDLDCELWKLGIPSKTRHNEVAPSQHELAAVYERVSIANDHNQLTMNVMSSLALKHGLVCLLHEKPFDGMNGSGKHNNWSIAADNKNLFDPGDNPQTNYLFLLLVVCVMSAVDNYADLLRMSVASASNDCRLGGNEAPPAIVSMFLGDEITAILEHISSNKNYKNISHKIEHGIKFITSFEGDSSDRNRTSPFAFTGTKFEFRMPGSSLNVACVNFVLNTAVADAIANAIDMLHGELNESKLKSVIKKIFEKHKRILFGGNGYSQAWQNEAKKRGLLNLSNAADALACYDADKNIALFKKYQILSPIEVKARQQILFEEYCKHIKIESLTMLDIVNRQIIPSIIKFQSKLASLIINKKQLKVSYPVEKKILDKTNQLFIILETQKEKLIDDLAKLRSMNDIKQKAKYYQSNILCDMKKLRNAVDSLEMIIPKAYWLMPTYSDILFHC